MTERLPSAPTLLMADAGGSEPGRSNAVGVWPPPPPLSLQLGARGLGGLAPLSALVRFELDTADTQLSDTEVLALGHAWPCLRSFTFTGQTDVGWWGRCVGWMYSHTRGVL